MIEEAQIKRIKELRENGLTIKEVARAIEVSESSVKKFTSDNYERDNKIDEKTGNVLTEQFSLENYDFIDDIRPLVYKLKAQANEQEITLYDYLKDISDIISKFLRITDNPERIYYIFMELANNLTTITNHIEAIDFINAINNFYDREIEFEKIEAWLLEQKDTCDIYIENKKGELRDLLQEIDNNRETLETLTNVRNHFTMKLIEDPNKILLENLKELQEKDKTLKIANKELKESLNRADTDNIMYRMIFEKITERDPNFINTIIREIEIENK
jgi:transcriptional regulator with XRE-family HTH domain